MTDYGHELEFGVFLTPDAGELATLLELSQLAEVLGLELVTLQDHPYQARFGDTWTLLSVIGARTSTIKVAPNVASLPLRPPVMLAKAAATLDVVTGGRVELGLGTGAFWDGIVAAGGPRRTPGEAVDALVEAIALIRAFWGAGTVRFDGEHYAATGLHAGPAPEHPIPIVLGAYGKRMLRVTGELADGWLPSLGYAPPDQLPEMVARLDDASIAAGRGPTDVRRYYNIHGRFGSGGGFLEGTPADWAEQLAELSVTLGFATYVLGSDDADTIRRFADEVVPDVRERVAAERARPDGGAPEPSGTTTTAPPSGPLVVRPTPDPDERLTGRDVWDEPSRPAYDEPAGLSYTAEQQAVPQHLVEVHDGLRRELAQVRDIVGQVRQGHLTVGAARSVINTMTMRQNNWTLGAYCESYCRFVATHHTLEDASIFPHLRRSEPGLAPVIDRLEEEHEVIADVLDALDRALVDLVGSDGTGRSGTEALDALEEQVDLLTDTLLSHLAYEERELLGPLARHGFN